MPESSTRGPLIKLRSHSRDGIGSNPCDRLAHHYRARRYLVFKMQNFLTALIEVFSVASFLFFTTAFIVGFVERDRELYPVATIPDVNINMDEVMAGYEAHHRPHIEDTVIPFTRPYRKPVCEPIDWQLWGLRDLRKASQRSGFGIPADRAGKSLTKPQFVELYEQALEGTEIAVDAA